MAWGVAHKNRGTDAVPRGTTKEGCGGLGEQIPYQGLAPEDIVKKVKQLAK